MSKNEGIRERQSGNESTTPQSGPVDAYWFPYRELKRGDLVILYTKNGSNSEKKIDAGSTSYFFYWRKASPIWVTGTLPIVVETSDWEPGDPVK